jgi:hypothetical protein
MINIGVAGLRAMGSRIGSRLLSGQQRLRNQPDESEGGLADRAKEARTANREHRWGCPHATRGLLQSQRLRPHSRPRTRSGRLGGGSPTLQPAACSNHQPLLGRAANNHPRESCASC